MSHQLAIRRLGSHVAMLVVATGAAALTYLGVGVAVSIIQSSGRLAWPHSYLALGCLVAEVAVPAAIGRRAVRRDDSVPIAIRRAALGSIALNLWLSPYFISAMAM